MKKWQSPSVDELNINLTAKQGGNHNNGHRDNGNNDTHQHLGWCQMHKYPELGICTCGALGGIGNADVDEES